MAVAVHFEQMSPDLLRDEGDRTVAVGGAARTTLPVGQQDDHFDPGARHRTGLGLVAHPHFERVADPCRDRLDDELLGQHTEEHRSRTHALESAHLATEIENLGRLPYEPVLATMRALHGDVAAGRVPGRVLLVEHEPVYTAGRATPAHELRPGIVPIERGGKITYHGPGQLTVYPIVRLPRRDVRDWLRRLEHFGMAIATHFGLVAEPSVDGTGVFVAGRKFASIGVHVKQWVNLHGIGVNVAMDLAPWHQVRPCGLSPDVMTDLSRAAGRPLSLEAAAAAAAAAVSVLTDADDPL